MLSLCFREQVIKHSLVHKVFLDFFLFAPDKQRTVSSSLTSHIMFYNFSNGALNKGTVWCEIKENTRKSK